MVDGAVVVVWVISVPRVVGGGWGCGCSMGYFSTQSGWWSFIRVPMVVE